jgi:AraC-like DNA-binding protein
MAKIVSSRVVAFNVPQTEHEVVRVQLDESDHFYDQLHQHPEIQIMFIEAGEGTVIAGDYVGRFQPDDMFIIGSGQPHVFRCDQSYYDSPDPTAARCITLYFNERYFGKELWGSNELVLVREFAASSQKSYQLEGEAQDEAGKIIRKLGASQGLQKLVNFFLLLKLLIETPDKKTLSIQPGRLLHSEEGRMNSIIEFTFRESHRKIYLSEVAQLANLSAEAFCRYFKLHTRKTYINFLNEVRVSYACQMLIHRDVSIQEICYQTGFSNISNFNRIFKKITKKTPVAFRQQLPFEKFLVGARG